MIQLIALLLFSFLNLQALATPQPISSRIKKLNLIIDPGHGGNDQGTSIVDNNILIKESNLTLRLGKRIVQLIKENHSDIFDVYLTRESNRYVGLQKRVDQTINKDADLYLSLHYNSAFSEAISGTEIYFPSNSSKYLTSNSNESVVDAIKNDLEETARIRHSLNLAKIFPAHWAAPRIKVRRSPFYVLEKSNSAALLIEVGYLTNADDRKLILDDLHTEKTANSILKALVEYSNQYKEMSDKSDN